MKILQKKRVQKFTFFVPAFLTLFFGGNLILPIFFAQALPVTNLSVSPPIFPNMTLSPGDSVRNTLKLFNGTNDIEHATLSTSDYTVSNTAGKVSFTKENDNKRYSLANWIHLATTSQTIIPGQYSEISFTIDVPKDAESGGKYGAILVGIISENNSVTNHIRPTIASLLLVTIRGESKIQAQIANFGINNPFVVNEQESTFSQSIRNEGNVHVPQSGKIVITDIFNHEVASTAIPNVNIFPGVIRETSEKFQTKNRMGIYHAVLLLTYDPNKQKLESSTSFLLLPFRYIIWLLIIIFLITILFFARGYFEISIAKKEKIKKV